MSQTEDYTAGAGSKERHIVIGRDRYITVPDELKKIAVQFDHNIETVTFDCPRYWDGIDMSKLDVHIVYAREGAAIATKCDAVNVVIDESDDQLMHFDWVVSNVVTAIDGPLIFIVCIDKTDENGNKIVRWCSMANHDIYIAEGFGCDLADIVPEIPPERPTDGRLANLEYSYSSYYGRYICNGIQNGSTGEKVVIACEIDGIPVGVITNSAFRNCRHIVSVTIPDSIDFIYVGAFCGCTSLSTCIFEGTKLEFQKALHRSGYDDPGSWGDISLYVFVNTQVSEVVCSDGVVKVDNVSKLISFTIDGVKYRAMSGMTFYEWSKSVYNTGSFYTEAEDYNSLCWVDKTQAYYISSGGTITGAWVIIQDERMFSERYSPGGGMN